MDAVVARLTEIDAEMQAAGPAPTRAADRLGLRPDLLRRRAHDGASTSTAPARTRPIVIAHANGHLMNVNSAMLELGEITRRHRGRGRRQVRRGRRRPASPPASCRNRRRCSWCCARSATPACWRPMTEAGVQLFGRAGLHAGRDHRHRPGQQAHATADCAVLEAVTRRRRLQHPHPAGLPGLSRHARRGARRRAREEPDAAQHRPAALRPGQDDARRFDPGLFGAAALARPFQRRAQRHLGHRARAVRGRLRDLPHAPACRSTPTPMATRPAKPPSTRSSACCERAPRRRPPPHAAARPDDRRADVPAHGQRSACAPTCSPTTSGTGATSTTR